MVRFLPTELGALTGMLSFDVEENELGGTIPTELGLWTSTAYLYLSGNQFHGTLPTELARMTNLEDLWVYDNQLSGTIPAEFTSMSQLRAVYLYSNKFTGSLNEILCTGGDRAVPLENLWADCSEVNCTCCIGCCDDVLGCEEVVSAVNETYPPSMDNWPQEFSALIDRLGLLVTDDLGVFQNAASPQYQAMDWLANRDEWNYVPVSNQVLVERYALAVLYYSTQGKMRSNPFFFLTNSSVCEWRDEQLEQGVTCDVDGISVTSVDLGTCSFSDLSYSRRAARKSYPHLLS